MQLKPAWYIACLKVVCTKNACVTFTLGSVNSTLSCDFMPLATTVPVVGEILSQDKIFQVILSQDKSFRSFLKIFILQDKNFQNFPENFILRQKFSKIFILGQKNFPENFILCEVGQNFFGQDKIFLKIFVLGRNLSENLCPRTKYFILQNKKFLSQDNFLVGQKFL